VLKINYNSLFFKAFPNFLERLFLFLNLNISISNIMTATISRTAKIRLKKVESLIGKTPLFSLDNIYRKKGVKIYVKLEWQQLGSSVKARPAFNIIKNAILNNELNNDITLLDATSGNTGIAYASIAAALGIKVKLALPENASKERKILLKSLGAELVLTSKFEGTDGAQIVAKELKAADPSRYYYADQYANEYNWKAHYEYTAAEIISQTGGRITHFINGLGTTGTFVGTGRKLKEYNANIQLISLQPNNPMHGLEGWKHLETARVPPIYDARIADENNEVDTLESYEIIKKVAKKEGLIISPSAAANILGAIHLAEKIDSGIIVTTLADDASKYSEVIQSLF
jgi:cysteine synthase B